MLLILLFIGLFALVFFASGWTNFILRDSKGRMLSRKTKTADEGSLIGLDYGTYTFEVWHKSLFRLRPKLLRTIEIKHDKTAENLWRHEFKLAHDERDVGSFLPPMERELRLYGEFLTDKEIVKACRNFYFKVLNNLYLPRNTIANTTEIDSLLIHPTGIYLFESENYSGWVFGKAEDRYWDLSKVGNNKILKSQFENPMMRCERNVRALHMLLGDNHEYHFGSYAVFGNKTSLKKVPESTNEMKLVLRSQLYASLVRTFSTSKVIYTEAEIDALEAKFSGYADAVPIVR